MKTATFLLATFSSLAICAPTSALVERELSKWSPELGNFYAVVDMHVRQARSANNTSPTLPVCDLSSAQMPTAPTPLPTPDPGLSLLEVAIGRGVQNYTCADSTSASKPASIGAVANLYNASTIAACYPDVLSILPGLALQIPYPSSALLPARIEMSGLHYFQTNTTPTFNLDLSSNPATHLGIAVGKKNANSTAPSTSIKSVDGNGNGAVVWLKLVTTNATVGNVKNVYRLNTAGGNPPATCLGMPPSFSVQYAAEYWFWGS